MAPLGSPQDSTCTAYGPLTFAGPSLDPTRVDAGPLRPIEAVHSYRPAPFLQSDRQRCLQEVPRVPEERPTASSGSARNQRFQSAPNLYVLNPTSLAKPHALQHLHADLLSYNSEVAIISETWFKKHHADQTVALPGYSLYRHDRPKRRGGGVAIYITSQVQSSLYTPSNPDERFEILWVKTLINATECYICALYHPPPNSNTTYTPEELVTYISETVDEISDNSSDSVLIIAGDFDQLRDNDFTTMGLINVVEEPTHQGHKLDRIYT